MSGHPVLPPTPITCRCCRCATWWCFPHMVIPLFRRATQVIKALEAAMEAGRQIMLVAQKAAGKDEPKPTDMFEVGCVSSILQMLKLPDGTVKVLVEGVQRANTCRITDTASTSSAKSCPGAAGGEPSPESRPCAAP
jgi:ATP-dependent Lon protease